MEIKLTGEALPRVMSDQRGLSCEFTSGKEDDSISVECTLADGPSDEISISNDLIKQHLLEEEKKLDKTSCKLPKFTPISGEEEKKADPVELKTRPLAESPAPQMIHLPSMIVEPMVTMQQPTIEPALGL